MCPVLSVWFMRDRRSVCHLLCLVVLYDSVEEECWNTPKSFLHKHNQQDYLNTKLAC